MPEVQIICGLMGKSKKILNDMTLMFSIIYINCKLQKFQIAWLKEQVHTVISMNKRVITRDRRVLVKETDGLFQLNIKKVKPLDEGWYMCQINTEPMILRRIFLEVKKSTNLYL